MLVGNKVDLEEQREVTYEEASRFADENGLIYIETSAKTGKNIEEAFFRTAQHIFKNIESGVIDANNIESGVQFTQNLVDIESKTKAMEKGCSC